MVLCRTVLAADVASLLVQTTFFYVKTPARALRFGGVQLDAATLLPKTATVNVEAPTTLRQPMQHACDACHQRQKDPAFEAAAVHDLQGARHQR